MISIPKLKIIIEEKLKTHERALDCLQWASRDQVETKIRAYKEVLGIINGPNSDCNCSYTSGEHYCPVHGDCNSSIPKEGGS